MKFYTLYLASNDQFITNGEAKECAAFLGITTNDFYCLVSRCRDGKNGKYVVLIEDTKTEKFV